jgi:E3 ubiquitin-protein ligase MARCH6
MRQMCRAGTLYFVRDPHDPNYSAVKEMIERPTHLQLRKVSATVLVSGERGLTSR